MKFTKMEVTGQLDTQGSARFARYVGVAYVLAAAGVACGGVAALIAAVAAIWK